MTCVLAVARTVRPRRSTRRPLVARRGLSSHRMAQGSGRARDSKGTTDDTHWKGDAQGEVRAPFRRRRQFAKKKRETHASGVTSHSMSRSKGQGNKGAEAKESAGQTEIWVRDLHDAGPARLRDRARQFPPNQGVWPEFFALILFLSRETESTKFASEEIATARSRHTSRRRRIPMPASPRRRARCKIHEAGAMIVALMSCYLVRLGNGGLSPPGEIALSLPACTQRSICRGAAFASRLDPLACSGDTRGRSKALFFAVLNATFISDPEPVNFSCDPENWSCGEATSDSTARGVISARISFPACAALAPLLDWLPACVAHDFCNLEDPDALGDDSSFLAVTLLFAECYVAGWPACCHPPHTKDATDSLEKDARATAVKEASGAHTCFAAHDPDA